MTKTVRIYLDVDGVINASLSGSPQHWGANRTGVALADGYEYQIDWAPDMIAELADIENVEIVWTTTWRNDAPGAISPLIGAWGDARVLHPKRDPEQPTPREPSIYWKATAIFEEQAEEPGPFIHIDDEISHYPQWKSMGEALGGLLISPNPHYGITKKHIEAIKEYVAKQQFVEDE